MVERWRGMGSGRYFILIKVPVNTVATIIIIFVCIGMVLGVSIGPSCFSLLLTLPAFAKHSMDRDQHIRLFHVVLPLTLCSILPMPSGVRASCTMDSKVMSEYETSVK